MLRSVRRKREDDERGDGANDVEVGRGGKKEGKGGSMWDMKDEEDMMKSCWEADC